MSRSAVSSAFYAGIIGLYLFISYHLPRRVDIPNFGYIEFTMSGEIRIIHVDPGSPAPLVGSYLVALAMDRMLTSFVFGRGPVETVPIWESRGFNCATLGTLVFFSKEIPINPSSRKIANLLFPTYFYQ